MAGICWCARKSSKSSPYLFQDPLENLFAVIRQQHGCNLYPSPTQFKNGIRQIYITHNQLTKISNITNCKVDDNQFAKLSNFVMQIQSKSAASPDAETELPILIGIDDEAELEIKESDIINNMRESNTEESEKKNENKKSDVGVKIAELNEVDEESDTKIFTEKSSIYYINGFLANKFLKFYNCQTCKSILVQETMNNYEHHKLFTMAK